MNIPDPEGNKLIAQENNKLIGEFLKEKLTCTKELLIKEGMGDCEQDKVC